MYDKDELAARLRTYTREQARGLMPGSVLVTVSANATQADLGYVWGYRSDRAVQVMVGNGIDVSEGEHVLRCLPPNDDRPSDPYIALGLEWNGADGSRVPRMQFKGTDGQTWSGAHTHPAADITDLFSTVSGYIQPGTGMVFSYGANLITIHNTATGGAGGGGSDLSDFTYTPAVVADWDGGADPGDADDAVNQLAERVADLEGLIGAVAIIADQKTSGTAGGTFTAGSRQTRTLNTEIDDPDGIVSISSNRFTPIAGTYLVIITAPSYGVQLNMAFLYNYTQSSDVMSSTSASSVPGHNTTIITDIITANGTDEYEVQHICQVTQATFGLGLATSRGTETYTVVTLIKIG